MNSTSSQTAARKFILVVDDDVELGMLIERWLSSAGYATRRAESGRQALKMLDECLPDMLVIDLDLGDMSGIEVLRQVRRKDRAVAVIMLTVSSRVCDVVAAMKAGATDYLAKPADRSGLLAAIASAEVSMEEGRRQRGLDAKQGPWHGIVGNSEPMRRLRGQIDRLAQADVSVLIGGETGTGKELVARAIHAASARAAAPFVAVNCGAIARDLQDSELFGHEKGAFTGALSRRPGRFEQAHGGSLFLDEVAELSPAMQASLLRVLQERRFYRVGGTSEVSVDVRVLAATHVDLPSRVADGRFREDLFYRLAVFELEVPPLRRREGDVLLLARRFLAEAGGSRELELDPLTEACLLDWHWPGNVRELRNAMARAAVEAESVVHPEHLPERICGGRRAEARSGPDLLHESDLVPRSPRGPRPPSERDRIIEALRLADGNVSQAMRELGIPRTTMYRKLRKYGLLPERQVELDG